ncbi:glycoside hydrolase family 127 protein [Spirosoma flavum]|uniref:Glycoside hydrolase family 127 protein n=1 Tax=Spirosoma flavum TaxID=2048557 RepID=A0ABW6AL10_9BACT
MRFYRKSIIAVGMLIGMAAVTAQPLVKPAVFDQLQTATAAQMTGFVGEKLDASYQNRILAQDVNRLVEPFRNRTETRCWQSEFWGKWFTSAVLAYRYRPEPALKAVLDKAVTELIATQTSDGYIGNYTEANRLEQWDIWGRKYCMLGLLAYYDLTKDKKSLEAARKVADHLMGELASKKALLVKQGNHRGMAATSVMEPICLLYARTGDKRYLDFAEEIVRQWESAEGPQLITKATVDVAKRFPKPKNWFGWEQGQKAYEMMSCYEGLLELYRLTGKREYRIAVEKTWENIRDTEINLAGSGSSVECWFGGKRLQTLSINHYQETCVTATWIKLSQQLLRLTGEAKYADAIEQTYYNALLGSMKADGSDWTKYTPLAGQRLEGGEQCGMGINCCVASGPRGLFTLPLTAVMSSKVGIQVNFFAEGVYHTQTPTGQSADVIQQTDYPVSGTITLKLAIPKAEKLTLRVRIPAWSTQSTVTINGRPVSDVTSGQYTEISRIWQAGDQVSLVLDMRGRVVHLGELPENIALVRGPIVLTRDTRLAGPNVDETISPVLDKEGYLNLKTAKLNQNGMWMQFETPFLLESHKEGDNKPVPILFCDYASAGNTLDDQSRFRVWLPQSVDPRK